MSPIFRLLIVGVAVLLTSCISTKTIEQGYIDSTYGRFTLGYPFLATVRLKSFNQNGKWAVCALYLDTDRTDANFELFLRQVRLRRKDIFQILMHFDFIANIKKSYSASNEDNFPTNCVITDEEWSDKYLLSNLRLTRWYPVKNH